MDFMINLHFYTCRSCSVCSSLSCVSFQTEAPIMIRPFLDLMTKSELNAVMTGGFATMAGAVLAAYISFGVRRPC